MGNQYDKIAEAMREIDFCMMQTVGESGVNTRPMSNNGRVDHEGENWFFSRSDSTKNREIEADDRVHLSFADTEEMSFIAVWGSGEIVDDVQIKKELWHEGLERWFDNGPEDPEVSLIRVTAHRIQTWGRIGDHDLDLTDA